MLRLYLYARVQLLPLRNRHGGPRVREAPGLPCALRFREGKQTVQSSGERCREIANAHLAVIPAQAGIQYSRGDCD